MNALSIGELAIFALSIVTIFSITIVAILTLLRGRDGEVENENGIGAVSNIYRLFIEAIKRILFGRGEEE